MNSFTNILVTANPVKIEFSTEKQYIVQDNESLHNAPHIRLIVETDFKDNKLQNIDEIKNDLKSIFEQAYKYFC